MADLKAVYAAVDEQAALDALDTFAERWDKKYQKISQSWKANWANLSTYFKYPQEVRKLIYTTNTMAQPTVKRYQIGDLGHPLDGWSRRRMQGDGVTDRYLIVVPCRKPLPRNRGLVSCSIIPADRRCCCFSNTSVTGGYFINPADCTRSHFSDMLPDLR